MYNESRGIAAVVSELTVMAERLTGDYEIIIADDASTDESAKIVREIAAKDPRVKLERLEKNSKFGGALRKGIARAGKEIIIYTDSDLPITMQNLEEALPLLNEADIVTAYSTIRKGETLKRVIMSKVYNFLIRFLFKTKIKDINSGFKIYKKKIFQDVQLLSNSPFVDVEIFVESIKRGFTVKQYPIIFRNRHHGKSYISRPAVIFQTMLDMMRLWLRR